MTIAELMKCLNVEEKEIMDVFNDLPENFRTKNFKTNKPFIDAEAIVTPSGAKAIKERLEKNKETDKSAKPAETPVEPPAPETKPKRKKRAKTELKAEMKIRVEKDSPFLSEVKLKAMLPVTDCRKILLKERYSAMTTTLAVMSDDEVIAKFCEAYAGIVKDGTLHLYPKDTLSC